MIDSDPLLQCLVCGVPGTRLYEGLEDRLFGAAGSWHFAVCPTCGSIWPDPRPAPTSLPDLYSGYYTHEEDLGEAGHGRGLLERGYAGYRASVWGYALTELSAADRLLGALVRLWPGRREDANLTVAHLPAGWRGAVLDIGCGSGRTLASLAGLGWDVVGIDPDIGAVRRARSRGLAVGQANLTALPFNDSSFDAATLIHSVEHVPDPRLGLREVARILRPGGRVVVATPNARSALHARYGERWLSLDVPRHQFIFSPEALERLLVEEGFVDVELRSTTRGANVVAQAAHAFRRKGHYDLSDPGGLRPRLLGEFVQLREAVRVAVHPHAGEELVARARRAP